MEMTDTDKERSTFFSLFTLPQWALFLGIIVAGSLFRWIALDMRPLHHDESLHAMFGKYYYDFPDHNYYKYDPMMHGPLLYNVLVAVYSSLGVSTWSARFAPAVIGTALMILPIFFRRYLKPTTILCLSAAISLSPTLIYWSRFIREDSFVVLGFMFCLYGLFASDAKHRAFFVLLGASIHFCSKENFIVHVAMLLGYLIFEGFFTMIVHKRAYSSLARGVGWVRQYPYQLAVAVIVAISVYIFFYSAAFRHWPGVVDGLYKGVEYWWTHHDMERIVGPFLFHGYVLAWYESLFVLLALLQAALLYWRAPRVIGSIAAATLAIGLASVFIFEHDKVPEIALFKFFKLKNSFDVAALVIFVVHSVLLTTTHLLEKNYQLAFFGYWFTANMFTYSYLGEKVPWLAMYPLLAGIVYLALYFQSREELLKRLKEVKLGDLLYIVGTSCIVLGIIFFLEGSPGRNWIFVVFGGVISVVAVFDSTFALFRPINLVKVVAVFAVIYNVRASFQTNFIYPGKASEFLSQVHTTDELVDLANEIRRTIELQTPGYRPRVFVDGEPVWPLTWYFKDLPEYNYSADAQERNKFKYQFLTYEEGQSPPPGYRTRRVNLRGWWVPEYKDMKLKNFLLYALNHTPWGSTGFSYATFNELVNEEPGKP